MSLQRLSKTNRVLLSTEEVVARRKAASERFHINNPNASREASLKCRRRRRDELGFTTCEICNTSILTINKAIHDSGLKHQRLLNPGLVMGKVALKKLAKEQARLVESEARLEQANNAHPVAHIILIEE